MAPRSRRVHIETRPHGNLQRRLRHAVVGRGTGLVHAGREHIAVPAHDNIHNDRSAAGTFIGRNGQIHGMADRPGEREGDRHPAGDSGIPALRAPLLRTAFLAEHTEHLFVFGAVALHLLHHLLGTLEQLARLLAQRLLHLLRMFVGDGIFHLPVIGGLHAV